MIIVIEFNGKAVNERADTLTLHTFDSLTLANKFIEDNTQDISKYWTGFLVVNQSQKIEIPSGEDFKAS